MLTSSPLPSLRVSSHASIHTSGKKKSGRGRDCEKGMKKQPFRDIKCLCEHARVFLSSRDRAQRSRTANYDSSEMSPELSAQMEIKRAVNGPAASQSDSHVNNIGGICCNLGIIYPASHQPVGGKRTICPLKVKMSISVFQEEKACVSYSKGTVRRA